MNQLVLLRGCPATGKSTWLKEKGLEQYTICPDKIRLLFQTPVANIHGVEGISQKNDKQVWKFVFDLLEQRMARGEFTIVDATHSRNRLITAYKKLCKKYRYRCTVVEFNKDLDVILEQNRQRESYKFVPEDAIRMIYERLKTDKIPGWVNVIQPDDYNNLTNILYDLTDSYARIVIFGDIHGCLDPLEEYFKKYPFDSETFYIFTGDYFDRGIQNAEVFKFVHNLMQYKNVLCLKGNHELHFFEYLNAPIYCDRCDENGERLRTIEPVGKVICDACQGSKIQFKSKAFAKSFKQFKEAGILDKDIKDFYNRLGQLAYFKYHDKIYVVTHGGIPKLPSIYTATQDYIRGIGRYADSDVVDDSFIKNTDENFYSIHAHRNVYKEPVQNTERTFNLCDDIEFGKYFRVLEITKEEHKTIKIKNNTYDKELLNRFDRNSKKHDILKLTENEVINKLNKDRDIIKKELHNGVFSYSFKNKVFRRRKWNKNTVKARGLFIDVEREKVVARSYDKFFNWGEREETKSLVLRESLQFPVNAYRKYNGFLGILSVHKGEWFIASKTTNDGTFAGWFKKQLNPYLTDALKDYIKKEDVSLVFEVVDVENDTHIIEYADSYIVLLDVVSNNFEMNMLPYGELKVFGDKYGFMIKEIDYCFGDWEALYKFKKKQDALSRLDANVEGWVFKDANGFQLKYKTTYYNFWKYMRSIRDAVVREKGDSGQIRQRLHSLDDFTVYNIMVKIPLVRLAKMSIIDVRNYVMRIRI